MDIREVEKMTGLTRASIRFYEKEGLISPKRRDNGYREYTEEETNLLLKIRLLRDIGVSLPTIRLLQEQKLTLSDVLREEQEDLHQETREQKVREKLTEKIIQEGASFDRLSGDYYLRMAEQLRKEDGTAGSAAGVRSGSEETAESAAYQDPEAEAAEAHPFRRYFARMTDFAVYSLMFASVYFLLLNQRPARGIGQAYLFLWFFRLFLFLLTMLIEPILLHLAGTTFGKWLFGIEVRDEDGRKLSMQEAFQRTFRVFLYGFAFFIPVFEIVRLVLSFRACRRNEPLRWERPSECLYTEPGKFRMAGFFASCVLIAFLSFFISGESVLAKNRGDLTVPQFAENYNDYMSFVSAADSNGTDLYYWLNEDGTFTDQYLIGSNVTNVFDTLDHQEKPEIAYETEDGTVREIVLRFRSDGTMTDVLPGEAVTSAYAFLGVQKGALFGRYYQKTERFFRKLQVATPEYWRTGLDCGDAYLNYELRSKGYAMAFPEELILVRDPKAEEAWCEVTLTIGKNTDKCADVQSKILKSLAAVEFLQLQGSFSETILFI